jgi:uncharacterized paraquat-inducible protein A
MSIAAGACPGCGLIERIPPLRPGDTARCPGCSDTLATRSIDTREPTLALFGAAIVLVMATEYGAYYRYFGRRTSSA